MKQIILATIAITIFAIAAFAQSKDEQAILTIHKTLEKAYIKGDMAPFETLLTDYYTYTGPNGLSQTRAEILKEMRDEIATPTGKIISDTTDNVKAHALGDAGVVTASWTTVSQGLGEGAEPHTDKGQYTGIYEKIDGKWMLVREMVTEAQHDRKNMEEGVLKASNAFDAAWKSRNKETFARFLYKDYLYTSVDGKIETRDEDLAHFGEITITVAESSDKKVRITGNTSAVETGQYHVAGSHKGKAFDETGRYTTTWVWRDGRWQIMADHNSLVKK